jgi:hypothetical protein
VTPPSKWSKLSEVVITEPLERTRKRDPLLIVAIVLAVAALGVGIFALVDGFSGGTTTNPNNTHLAAEVTVPNVLGMNVGSATSSLTDSGYTYTVRYVHSPNVAANVVAEQRPVGGSITAQHSVVSLVVSNGP